MKRALALTVLALSCILSVSPTWSQPKLLDQAKGDSAEEPSTQILSDSLTHNDATKTTRFTGNVVMTRGLLTLTSDQLDIKEDDEGFQYGTATTEGNKRVYIRQEKPENFEVLIGLGERAEYDGKEETFDLIKRARLVRYICGKPFDNVSGERIRYFQKTDTYVAIGGPTSENPQGRVRSVAQPRSRIDAAIEECKKMQAKGIPIPEAPVLN